MGLERLLKGVFLIAKALSSDNIVPDPTTAKNAANKAYVDENLPNISILQSNNLAFLGGGNVIFDKYISSSGAIANGTGWRMIRVDVSNVTDGAQITFGNFSIDTSGYSSFYNDAGAMLQYNGNHTNDSLPKTYTKPAGAKWLYIGISRPIDSTVNPNGENYAQITVNEGAILLPYQAPLVINSINDIPIVAGGGGEAYDQSLNTTDSVQFASIKSSALVINLPTSDTGLISGRAWIDTANGNVIKVKS